MTAERNQRCSECGHNTPHTRFSANRCQHGNCRCDAEHGIEELRLGQTAFNALAQWRPDIATEITGSDADPFYDDRRLHLFYQRVAELTAVHAS